MSNAKCLLKVPTPKRIRLVPTLFLRQRTAEVDGSLPFPPSIHSPLLIILGALSLKEFILFRIFLFRVPPIMASTSATSSMSRSAYNNTRASRKRPSRPDRQRYQYGLLLKVRRSITNSSLVQFVPQLSHLPLLINRGQEVNFQKLPT